LSSLYLIRHGQAGLRHNYDKLSDVGRRQARLLGESLAGQRVSFRAIYSGTLERQRQTAEEARAAYVRAGVQAPEIVVEPGWNEFDLDQVYRDFVPLLSEADAKFRADYAEMRRQAQNDASPVHRTWSECDTAVVRAWTEAGYACNGESWLEFQRRVTGNLGALAGYGSGESVAIFTSATPIAILMGAALGVANGRIMRLAGVMYNAALSTVRLRDGEVTMFSFNNVGHLPVELRTFR
jgi:broad specificity phosphatase PhoE